MARSRSRWAATSVGAAAVVIIVTLGLRLLAQAQQGQQQAPQTQQPPPPVFRTGINFVRVDVIVSDKNGQVVANLTPADFDVTEDGKPQTIEAFRLIKLDGGAAPTADGPPRPIR